MKANFMHVTAFQLSGEYSFLATANKSVSGLTGGIRMSEGLYFQEHEGATDVNGLKQDSTKMKG